MHLVVVEHLRQQGVYPLFPLKVFFIGIACIEQVVTNAQRKRTSHKTVKPTRCTNANKAVGYVINNPRYVRNFVLLGDPALRLAYPQFNIATKTVNTHPITLGSDTLKALSKVTITGEVRDKSGNKMTNFDGIVFPTVYDK